METEKNVAILGGGLAGMVTALNLVERGFDVTIYESLDRLGGKAGSDINSDVLTSSFGTTTNPLDPEVRSDHGYHLFPEWYVNTIQLWRKIGLDTKSELYRGTVPKNLHPFDQGHDFRPESKGSILKKLAVFDLITRDDDQVENQTLKGFLYSRVYIKPGKVTFDRLLLNALTIKEYDVSARSIRNVFRQWAPVLADGANWTALKGSLGRLFIDRLRQSIIDAANDGAGSIKFKLERKVVDLKYRSESLTATIEDKSGVRIQVAANITVLAIPQEKLRELNTDELQASEESLGELQYLRSNTFGALDIYFNSEIADIPVEHFRLVDSKYAITAFAISNHWPELEQHYPDKTVIQFVAGNSSSLNKLSREKFTEYMAGEIAKYLPEAVGSDVNFYIPHHNTNAPLFVNDVGVWDSRPTIRSSLENVYFAGDFVQHDTEAASMEGAIRSGLNAAEAIREDHAPTSPNVDIEPPMALPEWKIRMVKLFLPLAKLMSFIVSRMLRII